jgi:hypothetical protein
MMADNVTGGLPLRGYTWFAGRSTTISDTDIRQTAKVEGATKKFDDMEKQNTPGVKLNRRSNRQTTCLLVRNVSGFALLPRRAVTWAAGYRGRRVAGYARVGLEEVAGVVDEHLPSAGVANNDLFWLAVKGPSEALTPLTGNGDNVMAEGAILHALTAVTSGSTTAGRLYVGATTAPLNYVGRAMSANTTGQTNRAILIDLDTYKTN